MNEQYHIPVLLKETLEYLNIKPDGIYIDSTFGGGGHSKAILERLSHKGRLIAFDYDQESLNNEFNADNFILIYANFAFIPYFLDFLNIDKVDGIIADLGLSSHQIDTAERGFSFRFDSELDMRMNKNIEITAKHIVNTYSIERLQDIFSRYGQIHNSASLARRIVMGRSKSKIETTQDLVEVIKPLVPKKMEQKYLAKVFQAIRIEVNSEIENLKAFLSNLPEILKKGGRVAIITYHSVEDRLVKNFLKYGNFQGVMQTDLYGNPLRSFRLITKKPVVPNANEIMNNPRSRSAKLRVAELI